MATAATIKKNIAKLEAALKSKATPKTLKPKLEAQLVKSKAELSGINKGTKPKTSSTKSTQTALQKLKEMVNKNKKFKTYKGAGVDLEKDADRPALKTGKRIAKESGKTYYEYRANRIDVKQPPKKYPKLEKGGYMAEGGEVEWKKAVTKSFPTKSEAFKRKNMSEAYYGNSARNFKVVKSGNEWAVSFEYVPNDVLGDKYAMAKGGYYADGGETGNLEIIDFYVNEYPKDDIAVDINPKATFNGLYEVLNKKGDAYKYIGVADSLVRERVFQKLAEIKGVKYDVIYDMWMDSDYEKGGYMAKGGEMAQVNKMSKDELKNWLSENYGYRGVDGKGITKDLKDRTIENMRKEVLSQMKYNEKNNIKYAKGGLTEHGLKVGDTIVDNMFWDKSVKVLNSKTGYAVVHLETGERKEMKAMGGEMHRTQE